MFGFDGNTTFAFARPKLLTLSREALVDIIFDLFDQPEDLMLRLNGISDKRSTVNHFLTQPDHVTSYILSHLDVVELGRGAFGLSRSFREKKTEVYMTIRLNNAERHYEDVEALGNRLYHSCKLSSDASFAEATYICSQQQCSIGNT